MTHAEASFSLDEAFMALGAIRQVCAFRHWTLLAAHIRSTHAHLIVDGVADASDAIRDFKAYTSRALNRAGWRRRWARGGNFARLQDSGAVRAVVRYVVDAQGSPMAVYVAPDF